MSQPIIIIGINGQLASALTQLLGEKAIAFSSRDNDFSQYENVKEIFADVAPKAVINACAYTQVDKAEEEEEEAYKINALVPQALAQYCKELDIPFIHYSTDYVFAGDGDEPHKEDSPTDPVNQYGKTKLQGEQLVQAAGGKYLIFRTSWVYNAVNKNFLTTMLNLAQQREELSVVADQIGAPTYAVDLAKETLRCLFNISEEEQFPAGIYHLCGTGQTSWHEFAEEIFKIAHEYELGLKIQQVNAIPTSNYPTPAKRPLNSRLDCNKAKSILKIQMPSWQESLEECMELIIESNQNTLKRSSGS